MEKAKLHDTSHRLKILMNHVDKAEKADNTHLARTQGLKNLEKELDSLDEHLREKVHRVSERYMEIDKRTKRLEKHVFEKERPILQLVERELTQQKTMFNKQLTY